MPEFPCKITSLPEEYMKVGVGMIFQKNWPYTDLLNFHFIKVRV